MKLKILLITIFTLILLVGSVWTYKGQEFQDNQVIVYITGSSLTSEAQYSFEQIPAIKPGETTVITLNGIKTTCSLSGETMPSEATGNVKIGRLINGVKVSFDEPYTYVAPYHISKGLNWATIEMINALEIMGCVELARWGSRIQVMDLSYKEGGPRRPRGGHTRGLDADVAYMCTYGSDVKPCFYPDRFNAPATWTMVKTLAKYSDVQYIFLDQALIDKLKTYGQSNEPGSFTNGVFEGNSKLVRHWSGHDDHLHIRLRCSKEDSQCIEQAGGYRKTESIQPVEEIDETDEATEPALTS